MLFLILRCYLFLQSFIHQKHNQANIFDQKKKQAYFFSVKCFENFFFKKVVYT